MLYLGVCLCNIYCVRILAAKKLLMATKVPSNVTAKTCYSYGCYMPYVIISLSTLKLFPNQYYWTKHNNTTLCFGVMKICYLLHRNTAKNNSKTQRTPLYSSSYDVIYTLHMSICFHWISLGKICHVHYSIWSPLSKLGRRGLGTHFWEKQGVEF